VARSGWLASITPHHKNKMHTHQTTCFIVT
jgi:hypothetical protein